jgi:SAM-dependent methyltransferase
MNDFKTVFKGLVPQTIKQPYKNFKEKYYEKLYKGDDVFCSVCESKYKTFTPYGVKRRENARCLKCGSLERHRLLLMYLKEKTDIFTKDKIKLLHFAPEECFFGIFSASPNIEYYPCDYYPENFNYESNVEVTKVDITDIPFDTNFFDVILCNHVLEHIPDDTKAMEELKRVLKPNGWGIFQVPIRYDLEQTYEDASIIEPKAREKAYGDSDHVRWYGKDYKNKLTKAGFDTVEDKYVEQFSSEDIFKYGLAKDELIYYCKG